ncbi:MAG: ImmA/IrrE family metallo-endopeptidase [Gammaproteobacteria bacterium]|nr:ImmA/IrrE family metallo-endopeptidase [Gammaproteobacteria bacterium]
MESVQVRNLAFNRRILAREALQAAINTRLEAKLDQHSPLCIYGLCEAQGIKVRFNDINMEGMYQKGPPPRIHLSAHRPLFRRAYNCAHELGHHVFGHGSSIDELREDAKEHPWEDPREFLADTFAGFILMPIMGLRRAFATRNWTPSTTSAAQIYKIACDFGVGYETLLTHLSAGVRIISRARAQTLRRATPKSIRATILGNLTRHPLIIADRLSPATTIDAEVEMLILLPSETNVVDNSIVRVKDLNAGRLFRAVRPGISQASSKNGEWNAFIRVARQAYVGLAQYRHLQADPNADID